MLPSDAITGCDEGLFEDITSEIAELSTPGPDGESMLEDMENNGLEYHSGWDCCVPQIFWTYVVGGVTAVHATLVYWENTEESFISLYKFSFDKFTREIHIIYYMAREKMVYNYLNLKGYYEK